MTRSGEFPPAVVELIWKRDRGKCAMCGRGLVRELRGEPGHSGGWSIQHREARGAGGDRRGRRPWLTQAANGVLMCGDGVTGCHGEVETRERKKGMTAGFVVSALGMMRPEDVPIQHVLHGLVRLDNDGGFESAGMRREGEQQ